MLAAFFAAGVAWWQLQSWFGKIDGLLTSASQQHHEQNEMLTRLDTKVTNIEIEVKDIKRDLSKVHEEVHGQEIKLAVLESQRARVARKS